METTQYFLNDVVLLKIFSYLTPKEIKRFALVNKNWKSLIEIAIKKHKVFLIETYIGGVKWRAVTKNDGIKMMIIEKKDFIREYEQFLSPFNFSSPKVMLCFLTGDFYSLESIICENGQPMLDSTSNRNTFPVVKCRLVLSATAKIISQLMPPNVQSLFVVGKSLLSNDLKNYHGNTIRQSKLGLEPCKPVITSLVFPERPGSYRFVMRQVINDPIVVSK